MQRTSGGEDPQRQQRYDDGQDPRQQQYAQQKRPSRGSAEAGPESQSRTKQSRQDSRDRPSSKYMNQGQSSSQQRGASREQDRAERKRQQQ